MGITKQTASTIFLGAMVAVSGDTLLAQQEPVAKREAPATAALTKELAQTEVKLAEIRELVRPRPGEHVTNMAKIAWEHDPWEAALKAGREGKPILAWGECGAGVPCGYG